MKCKACGYEESQREGTKTEFIVLGEMPVKQWGNGMYGETYYSSDDTEAVYACPKCGTLRVSVEGA